MEKEEREILLTEWKAIREALLYFGNRRFAQFTVFMAISGFLFKFFHDWNATWYRLLLAEIGLVLTILFWKMEYFSVSRRDRFAERAEVIEGKIGTLELMRKSRPKDTLKSEARATYGVYTLILILWLLMLIIFLVYFIISAIWCLLHGI